MPRSDAVKKWLFLNNLTTQAIAKRLGLPGKAGYVTVERWIVGMSHPTGMYAKAVRKRWPDCPLLPEAR